MPKAYIRVDDIMLGSITITGNVHPAGAKVTCKSGIKEYTVGVNQNQFKINLNEPVPRGKLFRFTVEMPGWIESYLTLKVR
jgi:hypothetical protein